MELRSHLHEALLRSALTAAARGWHVFPLRPDRPGDPDHGKRPAFPARCTADRCDLVDPHCRKAGRHVGWEERATTDPGRIRRAWSQAPYGVGIACGPSGLVVVDLDMPKHANDVPPTKWAGASHGLDVLTALADRHGGGIDATYTVTTGSGGSHLYYRHPTGTPLRNTTGDKGGGLGWKVDTRAHGGYVVAADTTVAGRSYTVDLDTDPAPLPGWLAGLLAPRPTPPLRPRPVALSTDRRGAYLAAAIRAQVDRVENATEGTRNHALYISAVALGQLSAGGALTEDDVYAVLEPAARTARLDQRETIRTIRSGLRAGARRPRSVAA